MQMMQDQQACKMTPPAQIPLFATSASNSEAFLADAYLDYIACGKVDARQRHDVRSVENR